MTEQGHRLTQQAHGLGLRARKRAATFDTIEREALDLVMEHGYENVTIDMICEASMVSPRTFFNYFGSKEGVILGVGPATAPDHLKERFVHEPGEHILSDLIELISEALEQHNPDRASMRKRRMIIHSTPDLAMSQMARMHAAEDELIDLILKRFEAQGRAPSHAPDVIDEARMIVSLTTGVMHSMMRKWFTSEEEVTRRQLLTESLALVRRVMQNP